MGRGQNFPEETEIPEHSSRWRALALLSLAELLGMSLWFSAAAVVPALRIEWNLSDSNVSWLTIAVQIGFVCGTLLSAFLNLPDIISVRYLFALSAFAGALTNAAFGAYAQEIHTGIVLRFLTGMFLAGVYPPGMKIMATWFQTVAWHGSGRARGSVDAGQSVALSGECCGQRQLAAEYLSLFHCWRSSADLLSCCLLKMGHTRRRRLGLIGNRQSLFSRIAACAWRASATSATCGSCTPCGPGYR